MHLVQVMSRKQLDKFLRLLKASPSGAVFNPWWQIDEENDIGPNCTNHPAANNYAAYVQERLGRRETGESLAKLSVIAVVISAESR